MTDVTRREYRVLTEAEQVQLRQLKSYGEDFIAAIQTLTPDEPGVIRRREYSLAITKIEEAVMWAVKGFTA